MVDPQESEKLYEDTRCIYERYSPRKVKTLIDVACDKTAAAQSFFFLAVQAGWETHGIELDEPAYNYVSFSASKNKGVVSSTKTSTSRSASVHSLSSIGSGSSREDFQQLSAPKLPPRTRERESSPREHVPAKEKQKEGHKKILEGHR